jgi:RNA polymerase sigma factor (TIGR02999 family)
MTGDAKNEARTAITVLLREWRESPQDGRIAARLMDIVYAELRRMAAQRLARETRSAITPTELVHETWLRLVPQQVPVEDRHAFFRFASVAMRNALVDEARERASLKRGSAWQRVTMRLTTPTGETEWDADHVLDLDRALDRLAADHPRVAEIIGLRVFAGLDLEGIADTCRTSLATVKRDLTFGRAWLSDALGALDE